MLDWAADTVLQAVVKLVTVLQCINAQLCLVAGVCGLKRTYLQELHKHGLGLPVR